MTNLLDDLLDHGCIYDVSSMDQGLDLGIQLQATPGIMVMISMKVAALHFVPPYHERSQ